MSVKDKEVDQFQVTKRKVPSYNFALRCYIYKDHAWLSFTPFSLRLHSMHVRGSLQSLYQKVHNYLKEEKKTLYQTRENACCRRKLTRQPSQVTTNKE